MTRMNGQTDFEVCYCAGVSTAEREDEAALSLSDTPEMLGK